MGEQVYKAFLIKNNGERIKSELINFPNLLFRNNKVKERYRRLKQREIQKITDETNPDKRHKITIELSFHTIETREPIPNIENLKLVPK